MSQELHSPISIKPQSAKVSALAKYKTEGNLFLPDLQRGFVWSAERVKLLFDSLSRGYPVGALLLWRWTPVDKEAPVPLETRVWDLNLGADAGTQPPKPNGLYVLDGQQRLTALFRVLLGSQNKKKKKPDPDLYVSLSSDDKWASDRFHLYSRELQTHLKSGLLIPASILFARIRGEDESKAIRTALKDWLKPEDDAFFKALDVASLVRETILGAEILAYEIDADIDRNEDVIEIFVRLNRQGVPLTPGDLAAARLTGKMTQFRDKATKTLGEPGFEKFATTVGDEERKGGFVDADLLIRTALFLGTGFIKYSEAERRKPKVGDNAEVYDKVEPRWEQAKTGLVEAVTTLKNIGIPDGSWIASRFFLLPMAVAAASAKNLGIDFWRSWLLSATLWGHYSKAGETRAQSDLKAAIDGNQAQLIDSLKHTSKRSQFAPTPEDLAEGNVNADGVLLALLLSYYSSSTCSFPSEKFFRQLSEPVEIHHIFAKELFRKKQKQDSTFTPDRIGNLTPLYRSDNNALSSKPPLEYLPSLTPEVRAMHFIPEDQALWDLAQFDEFCTQREAKIAKVVCELLVKGGLPAKLE